MKGYQYRYYIRMREIEYTAYLINRVVVGGEYGQRAISAPRIDMTWPFTGHSGEPQTGDGGETGEPAKGRATGVPMNPAADATGNQQVPAASFRVAERLASACPSGRPRASAFRRRSGAQCFRPGALAPVSRSLLIAACEHVPVAVIDRFVAKMFVSDEGMVGASAGTVYRSLTTMREHHPHFLLDTFSGFQVE